MSEGMNPFGHSPVTAVRLGVYVAMVCWIESVEAHDTRAIENRASEKKGGYTLCVNRQWAHLLSFWTLSCPCSKLETAAFFNLRHKRMLT